MTAEQNYPNGPAASGPAANVPRPLHRSASNRVFAGVCGGLAEHFGADATAVRFAAVILDVFTGIFPLLLVYLIAAIIIPEAAPADGAAPRASARPGSAGLIFGSLLVLLGLAGVAQEWLRVDWDLMWPIVLIGLGGVIVALTAARR
jgi:phage shock protein C